MICFLQRRKKVLCWFFIAVIFFQTVGTSTTYALTGGPSQPEVQSFKPAGTSDMVEIFSGDFSYNIPLFELPGPNGGYPFNLSYQSGISMDQEASWVGIGWNLNPGAITRQMRGLPDEFKNDPVFTKMSINPNVTIGLGLGVTFEIFGKDKGGLTVGFSVYQNNYKGMGYTIDGSVSYQKANSTGQNDQLGLSTSLDSQEGISVSPTIGLGTEIGTIGLGVGYNSKSGLSTMTVTQDVESWTKTWDGFYTGGKTRLSQSATISLAHPGYTPQVTMPMRSVNITGTFKLGAGWWGAFPDAYVTGFYNEQWLKHDKQKVRSGAFGYLHYQDIDNASAMTDFNREKDGMVSTKTPNLGIPSLSYDIYTVAGQGISAMYRPMRNDYGIVHDPETISKSTSAAVGVDVGIPAHVGVNLSVSHSESTSGLWSEKNDMTTPAKFQKKNADSEYEPWYFKVHGELSTEKIDVINKLGGDNAVRVKLLGEKDRAYASTALEKDKNKNWSQAAPVNSTSNRERKPRSQVIQTITNEELLSNGNGTEVLPQFKVRYIDEAGNEQDYNRSGWPGHHIAAFTALTPEGLRYNYGIPAYNLHQEEVSFSVRGQAETESRVSIQDGGNGDPYYSASGTDKFLKRVELPKYAHAHLLTSIIGPDYVDVKGDGVTSDDLGYWVKFTYKRTNSSANPYEWRDPFSKAHLQKGWRTDPTDDRGSFVYGKKELFYLAKAETKSHVATFILEERLDGKGVADKLQNDDNKGKSSYALKEVRLYTRSAGTAFPIKVVRFTYDYTLCPGVYNNASTGGKLTLKKVWFEYGNSERGSLNPYTFTYHTNNPGYDILSFDRWGVYKPYPANQRYYNNDFPYAEQDPAKKEQIDNNAAAWSLTQIQLPSGGKIIVDYESDDYAYVQHKQAMQMMSFVNPNGDPAQAESGSSFTLDYYNPKIRFKLESPIPGTFTEQQQKAEVLKYIDQVRKQLYFKININLLKGHQDAFEFISGYADIDDTQPMGLEQVSGHYTYGYFYLKKENGFHPFAVRAWQHLRTNQPDLANYGSTLNPTSNTNKRIGLFKALATMASEVRKMFEGFNKFCRNKDWGKEVAQGKSWIRLNSVDKIKYGGGLRVKQITLKDGWSHDEEGIYGQVYDYTLDENGKQISSGVATYEPFAGGEENALHYAKKYTESVALRSHNNLFFEYPINETYYPGPQVGYRKVAVMSLASAFLAGKMVKNITLSDQKDLFPKGENVSYGTTGMTVHEFYTAKDFPVITEETEIVRKPYQFAMILPFYGSLSVSKLTATQGYSIITNDMHGKQKMVSNYRQDKRGILEPDPISWVKYNYLSAPKIYEQEKVSIVKNTFKNNPDGTVSVASSAQEAKFTIGQEQELFSDMRQYSDHSWNGGARYNVEALVFFLGVIPVPSTWPTIGETWHQLRTSSTNKVIFKSGILESVEASDGGSLVKTENRKWDKLTGATVLTVVNNNFDKPVFQYSIPAYTQYQGMGAAYQNTGLTFTVKDVQKAPYEDTEYLFSTTISKDKLFPGDEIILYAVNTKSPVARVVYTGEEEGELLLHSTVALTASSYQAMIVRSGYRNQLSVSAGNVTALKDPSEQGTPVTYTKTITIPQED